MELWLPILVALAPTYLVRFSIAGIPSTLLELFIYIIFVAALATKNVSWKRIKTQLTPMWWWGIALILIGVIIGSLIAQDHRTAFGLSKAFVFDPLLVFFLIVGTRPRDDHWLILWLTLSATVVSLISLIAWWAKLPWAVAGDGRLLGLFGIEAGASPNYLALYLAPIAAAGITWLCTPLWKAKWWQVVLGVATVVNLAAVAATQSRAGIATAILGGIIGIIIYNRRTLAARPYARPLGVVALFALILFGIALVQPDFSLSAANGGRIASSNNIRWDIWHTTEELIAAHPITGLGLGNFQQKFGELTANRANFPEYITPWAVTPHNLFLNYWVQFGAVGLIGLIMLLVAAFIRIWKTSEQLNAAVIAALLSTIVLHGLVDTPAWKNDLALLFWAGLAVVAALKPLRND